jgi:hypothetical protein
MHTSKPGIFLFQAIDVQSHRRDRRPLSTRGCDPLQSDMTHVEQDETGSAVSFHQSCTSLRALCDLRRVPWLPPARYSMRRAKSSARCRRSSASWCALILRSRSNQLFRAELRIRTARSLAAAKQPVVAKRESTSSVHPQNDFAELFAIFHSFVGFGAFFEGQDDVNHGLEQAAAQQFQRGK